MSLVNILFAIDLPVWNQLASNFIRNENGVRSRSVEFTDDQERQLREHFTGMWKAPKTVGAPDVLVSWFVPNTLNEAETGLQAVDNILSIAPNKIDVFGAWNKDGTMYGQVLVPAAYNEQGQVVTPEEVTGLATYPLYANYMSIFPDDVVHDAQGNETSRTPALAPKEVHKLFGWKDRRWT